MAKSISTFAKEQQIFTPEFRVSYPHVLKPSSLPGSTDLKYSVQMLFPKKTDLSVIKLAIKHAKITKFGPDQNEWPEMKSPVDDGDSPKYASKTESNGCWIIKAVTDENHRPVVVDANNIKILNEDDFYAGCYARAVLFCRVWEFAGKYGIHFLLDGVQKTREGERLGSRRSTDNMFAPIGEAVSVDDLDESVGF